MYITLSTQIIILKINVCISKYTTSYKLYINKYFHLIQFSFSLISRSKFFTFDWHSMKLFQEQSRIMDWEIPQTFFLCMLYCTFVSACHFRTHWVVEIRRRARSPRWRYWHMFSSQLLSKSYSLTYKRERKKELNGIVLALYQLYIWWYFD